MKQRVVLFLLWSFSAAPLFAYPPSGGIIEREIEKEYESTPLEPEKEVPSIQIDIPQERLDIPEGTQIPISSIQFKGNQSLSSQRLQEAVSSYLSSPMSIRTIYELCHTIDLLYAKEGYFLARAYPPPQELIDGVLTIAIIEGSLGFIRVEGNRYYSDVFVKSYFSSMQWKPLRESSFLKALMLLNENSDLNAVAIFQKGVHQGFADVILRIEDRRPIHLSLNGNNYGKNLTTNMRAGAKFSWGNCLFEGALLSVAEVVGFPLNALYFSDVTYKVPLNRIGSSLELSYLFSQFKVEEHPSFDQKGKSSIATLKFSQAVTRTRKLSIDLFSYFDYKQIQNFALGQRTSFDKLRVLTGGASLDYFVPSFSRDFITVQFSGGIPDFLGGLKSVDRDCSRWDSGGRFFVWTVDYDRIQHLPKQAFLYLHASTQLSPGRLPVPEEFYIGGIGTVRGFPLVIGVGDNGYYTNLELRTGIPHLANKRFFWSKKTWGEVFQFDLFFDHGGTVLQGMQNLFLWGCGLGIRCNRVYGVDWAVDVGFPLNHRDLSKTAFVYFRLVGQPF